MSSKIATAPGETVRSWARENGFDVGDRGRFSAEVTKAFNDAHKGSMRYTPGAPTVTVPLKVKVTSAKTQKVRSETKQFTPAEVRALASKTMEVPSKGPLSKQILEAAAANFSSN